MRKLLIRNDHDNPCQYHRLLMPSRWLSTEPEFEGRLGGEHTEASADDVVMQHGLFMPEMFVMDRISPYLHKGCKFAWAIDDDYTSIPDWNVNKLSPNRAWTALVPARMADFVVVSTPHLATRVHTKGQVLVAPNLMDLTSYPCEIGHPQKNNSRFVRIMWIGSNTHSGDVKVAEKGLDHILAKYQGKVEVLFMGAHPPDDLMRKWLRKGLFIEPSVSHSVYNQVLCQAAPHIIIAPMQECEFNLSKSAIRPLEGMALSAAVVASDFGEYSLIKHGEDGLLCKGEDDWAEALDSLVADPLLRIRLGNSGRRRVEAEYNWANPNCRESWRMAFRAMLNS